MKLITKKQKNQVFVLCSKAFVKGGQRLSSFLDLIEKENLMFIFNSKAYFNIPSEVLALMYIFFNLFRV